MTKRLNRSATSVIALLGVASIASQAGVASAAEISDSAQSIKVGEGDLFLSGGLGYQYDDNKNRTATNESDLTGVVVSPTVVYKADQGSLQFQTSYEGGYGSFDDSAFDFDDHRVEVSLGSELSRRWRLGANFNVTQRHDDFDNEIDATNGIRDNFVVINSVSADVGFRYGAQGAKGNLEGGLLVLTHDLEELDFNPEGINPDFDLVEPSLQFSLRLSQDTRLTLGVTHGQFDFDNSVDRSITRTLLGLQFSQTGKVRGFFRVGNAVTRFDDSRSSFSTFVFDSVITYLPVSFSRFVLRGSRRLDNRDNSAVDFSNAGTTSDIVSLSWIHKWGSRFSTDAFARLELTDRECPAASEDLSVIGLTSNYQLFNKVSLGLGVQQESQTGDLCAGDTRDADVFDYDRQRINVSVNFTL